MGAQRDLQDWLRQLKQRAEEQQKGKSQARRSAPNRPAPSRESETQAGYEIETDSAGRIDGMSATDIALQRLREEERKQQEARRQEQKKRARAAQARAAKRLKEEGEAARRAEADASRASRRNRKPRKRRKSAEFEAHQPAAESKRAQEPLGAPEAGITELYRKMRGNRKLLRQAVILSEILAPPKSMRKDQNAWDV